MDVVAPNSVNYGDQLPLGIEAKSNRRLFFPSTGDSYASNGTNIIRITLNADSMLDTSQSYLKFDLKNTTDTDAVSFDLGQPVISRLVISSGGVVLEDIQHYNHLVGGILAPAQYGAGQFNTDMLNRNALDEQNQAGVGFGSQLKYSGIGGSANKNNGRNSVGQGDTISCCYKLYSGLLDNDKYLPLVLMNNGIDIEIHLAGPNEAGCSAGAHDVNFEITSVRYVAHLVELQRDFYDMLRMTQQNSGGVLQIAGQSFRNFTGTLSSTATGEQNINVPVRARSIKSIFFKSSRAAGQQNFTLSAGSSMSLTQYQVKIGATNYPPTAVQVNEATNKIEPYLELEKSFGKLGSTIHSNLLGNANYLIDHSGGGAKDGVVPFAPYGLDLESFRAEIENGVDTSSRALPMTLSLTLGTDGVQVANTVFVYALIDTLFFVNMDGSVSVSS